MRVIALMSWFDERSRLAGRHRYLAGRRRRHVVAVDGAYGLYPEGTPTSAPEQRGAIESAAQAIGLGCMIYEPDTVWQGGEVEKRDTMFRLAEQVAEPNVDWYLVIDGDEVVTECCDLHAALEAEGLDAGVVPLWQYRTVGRPHAWPPSDAQQLVRHRIRKLFRAIPGLGVRGRHFHYMLPDGRALWRSYDMVEASEFDMRVYHRRPERDGLRDERRQAYYAIRDQVDAEGVTPDPSSYIAGVEAERAEHLAAGNLDRVRDCDTEIARALAAAPRYRDDQPVAPVPRVFVARGSLGMPGRRRS